MSANTMEAPETAVEDTVHPATETPKAQTRGRRLDLTPGKVISETLVEKIKDEAGKHVKSVYAIVYNDENGVRTVRQEERVLGKRGAAPGRSIDHTPNREFAAKRVGKNEDGTIRWELPYNDADGVRQVKFEDRPAGKRGNPNPTGRNPDATPGKVIVAIKAKKAEDNTVEAIVPYNDNDGVRHTAIVVLKVNKSGNLSAKVSAAEVSEAK